MSILDTLPEEAREHLHQTALDVAAVYGGQGYHDFLHTVAHMMMPTLGDTLKEINGILHDYRMSVVKPYYVAGLVVLLMLLTGWLGVLCFYAKM